MSFDPKKYRIKETIDGNGVSIFHVQRRTFWGWRDLYVNCIARSRTFSGSYDEYLDGALYGFGEKEDCIRFYKDVISWKDVKYKGEKIIKTWQSHDPEDNRYVIRMTNPHTFETSLAIHSRLSEARSLIDYWDRKRRSNKTRSIFHKF